MLCKITRTKICHLFSLGHKYVKTIQCNIDGSRMLKYTFVTEGLNFLIGFSFWRFIADNYFW